MSEVSYIEIELSEIEGATPELCRILDCLPAKDSAFIWETGEPSRQTDSFTSHLRGRFSYLGVGIRHLIRVQNETVFFGNERTIREVPLTQFDNNPLLALKSILAESEPDQESLEKLTKNPEHQHLASVGAFGFVSYDCARYFETIAGLTEHPIEPDLYFVAPEILICVDRKLNRTSVLHYRNLNDLKNPQIETYLKLIETISLDTAPQGINLSETDRQSSYDNGEGPSIRAERSRQDYIEIVSAAKEYIKAGDIFQVVLSNQLNLPTAVDPIALYELLRKLNPSPYHFLLRFGGQTLVGASPEVMLRAENIALEPNGDKACKVAMRLVAGTYPFCNPDVFDSEAENKRRAKYLQSDEKERAEHLMLVDHARNDIGRVARTGSVKVSDLFSVESYSQVHHLISQVSGILKPECSVYDALQSCFPIATLTGTPKIRAMEIIAELEGQNGSHSRGIFGGAVGMIGFDGSIDTCVAIRCLSVAPESTSIQIGAGIVADSNPSREYDECMWKAEASLRAVDGALRNRRVR